MRSVPHCPEIGVLVKKCLLLLVPLALFAQVQVDTVIRLPHRPSPDFYLRTVAYLPELNKLYVAYDPDRYYVVDCSTYQVVDSIWADTYGGAYYAWNWRRLKLYALNAAYSDSTLVIDAAADTIIRRLGVYYRTPSQVYLSDVDQLYRAADDTLYAFDGATDSVVRRKTLGWANSNASWDSAGRKLYVGQGTAKELYVYDYIADSVLKVIDVSGVSGMQPDALLFNQACHKAYLAPFQIEPWDSNVGIIDTERDTMVGVLSMRMSGGLHDQAAVDDRDNKVYLADGHDLYTPGTLWVVDCATDSVLREVEYGQGAARHLRWVPWSNRLYFANRVSNTSYLQVLDCRTDSFIGTQVLPNSGRIQDIQLDPVHERIFVVGVDTFDIYVLRDTGYGVAEDKPAMPRLASGLHLQPMPGWYDIRYSTASPCRVDLSVYDLMGREVRRLVADMQFAGQHSVVWNCTDGNRTAVARGVYFIRLDTPGFRSVKKAVVTR
jgi:hypothetical protein